MNHENALGSRRRRGLEGLDEGCVRRFPVVAVEVQCLARQDPSRAQALEASGAQVGSSREKRLVAFGKLHGLGFRFARLGATMGGRAGLGSLGCASRIGTQAFDVFHLPDQLCEGIRLRGRLVLADFRMIRIFPALRHETTASVLDALLAAETFARAFLGDLSEHGQGFSGRAAMGQFPDGGRRHPAVLG